MVVNMVMLKAAGSQIVIEIMSRIWDSNWERKTWNGFLFLSTVLFET